MQTPCRSLNLSDGDAGTLFCKSSRSFYAFTVGKLDQIYRYYAESDSACTTIAPGVKPPKIDTDVDTNGFHCSFGDAHERLRLETAKHRGVTLTSGLRECEGCSMAKGRGKPIAKITKGRVHERGGRVFLDL